ncbi:hypothetical protein [Rufibacter sp. XAAS-G3-1]|uniref:hypothetical protein n=1 Tax=Rufibacter sp. XAAS-G3-1 TaxID=2729134 RepID=UPI0015E7872D|nr:hypothetical protein [Rufibacter sp. XAAS-G3-1]
MVILGIIVIALGIIIGGNIMKKGEENSKMVISKGPKGIGCGFVVGLAIIGLGIYLIAS